MLFWPIIFYQQIAVRRCVEWWKVMAFEEGSPLYSNVVNC